MVDFLPFRGLVPRIAPGESIEERVSPPYDVIGEEERKSLQSYKHNVTKLTLGAEKGSYARAAKLLGSWISEGRLQKDERECYYLLRQTFQHEGGPSTRTGLVGALRLEDYGEGNISPHEETFSDVKEDRLNLLRSMEAHLESIFCLYDRMSTGLMAEIEDEAEILFEVVDKDGTKHAFGRISDGGTVRRIAEEIAGKKLLIADGHHRYETALKYSIENAGDEKKRYVLATLVPGNDPGLAVMPTHRIFKNVQIATEELLQRASSFFAIWEMLSLDEMLRYMRANDRVCLGVIMANGQKFVFELAWKPADGPLWSVDTYVCEELILNKILSKKGEVTVEYDHDALSVAKKMENGAETLAVILSPPKLETIWQVAKEGERMPKKSTYFHPKVWSGFVAYNMR